MPHRASASACDLYSPIILYFASVGLGLSGARDEFLLAATVQNLRRLVKLTAPPLPQPA
jgi:hypothetical protein